MKRYNLFLPEEAINELNYFARQQQVSTSAVIRYAVREFLDHNRRHPVSGVKVAAHAVMDDALPQRVNG